MKKNFYIILFFYLFISPANAKIVYIDIKYILNSSEIGISLNNYISGISEKNNIKFKKLEEDLIKKEKNLIIQQNIIEKVEFEEKLKKLSNEVNNFRSNKKKSNNNIKQLRIQNTKKILNLLNPIVIKYVEQQSISIVLPKKNIIVGKKNLDITNEILTLLNKQVKKLDFSNE